jgi:hypothetical protein
MKALTNPSLKYTAGQITLKLKTEGQKSKKKSYLSSPQPKERRDKGSEVDKQSKQ